VSEILAGALAELYARVPRGMELGLDKMLAACTRFDHPEAKFKVIHVAGTNGKGSVCAMVESMLRASGKKTGLYTSPHLHKFSERIRVDGIPISDQSLERILSDVLKRAPELSFFEAATLTAFVAFNEARVDVAILEVGIGGRLDATNVIEKPLVTAITRIAFDHMDKLGNTIEEIAREKAGIAKPGVPLVLGWPIQGDVRKTIEEVARRVGAPVVDVAQVGSEQLSYVDLGLKGNHQAQNAHVAVKVARLSNVDDRSIIRGLRDVRWPGRLERIETENGPILLDAAHNPDGANALATYVRDAIDRGWGNSGDIGRPVALVFGTLADKAWPEMLDALAPLAKFCVYTAPKGRAPTSLEAMNARHPGKMAADPIAAFELARELLRQNQKAELRAGVQHAGLIVVAGSIFLVAEIRGHILNLPSDPVVAL
jgi:dihydrofolate synthase / folylpolyglutamate synthase